MINDVKKEAEQRMQRGIEAFKEDLRKLRTGRAHAGLLETVMVEYYGTNVPVKQTANVSVEDARTIVVTPWEKNMVSAVEKAIINAGLGKGQPLGTGHFRANRQTAQTNFVAAHAQCEAALEILRAQNQGHLVTISSMSAMRGFAKNLTTYAATKAGLAALSEGIRADLLRTPIRVSTIYPGYIRSEMNEKLKNTPFIVDTETGCRALVAAIEHEPAEAHVPRWPWAVLGPIMKRLPLSLIAKLS